MSCPALPCHIHTRRSLSLALAAIASLLPHPSSLPSSSLPSPSAPVNSPQFPTLSYLILSYPIPSYPIPPVLDPLLSNPNQPSSYLRACDFHLFNPRSPASKPRTFLSRRIPQFYFTHLPDQDLHPLSLPFLSRVCCNSASNSSPETSSEQQPRCIPDRTRLYHTLPYLTRASYPQGCSTS
ncbi:hypothetical protein BKA65DRAFT_491400 [Rhexocercosporidium sp. MPI-PUGE-AT-0058]|nr:hypothetical protein BKA65DRAFT_491400 [Rhexocercosporidium sp. MPI-PUGE-AT-0058]